MIDTHEREQLLEDIRDAADDYREAEQHLDAMVLSARLIGLPESDIQEARGMWL